MKAWVQTLMVSIAAASLAACAAPDEPAAPAAPVQSSGIAAPTPSEVTTRINMAQMGQTVDVRVGQRFAVELVGVPTAGYVWAPASVPAFLTRAGEESGPTSQAQRQPGFVGGNHWEVLMFAATAAGTGELVLEQRRPWESNEPANATFRVTIQAR